MAFIFPLVLAASFYLSQKYALSFKESYLLLFSLIGITIFPPLLKLNLRSIREVEKLIKITGLRSVYLKGEPGRGTLIARGEYGGLYWRIYKKLYSSSYFDELIFITVELPEGVDFYRVVGKVKELPKVEKVRVEGNLLEVMVLEGDIESYRELLRVMNAVLREAGLSPPVREEGVIR